MNEDKYLTELERQQKYLSQLPGNFSFPLFNAKTAVESQRKSGYRDTAAAAREIVDNGFESGARHIHVIFETERNGTGKSVVSSVAFVDDGPGMVPKMARYALTWGGGTHFDDPSFIGKFGFGLPNASINQTRRTEVYTRTHGGENFRMACLDIDVYRDYDLQSIPDEVEAELPPFVQAHIAKTGLNLDHGTVVVWKKPDRLTYRTPAKLKDHLLNDFGVTYRYLLVRGTNPLDLRVEGIPVEPVDPLFLMPEARYYVKPDEGGARCSHEFALPVYAYVDQDTGHLYFERLKSEAELEQVGRLPNSVISSIYLRIARFPLGFVLGTGQAKKGKTDAYKRFEIRKSRRGMSFVRADREIEVLDAFPKTDQDVSEGMGQWPLLQTYAYHWGIEVRFSAELDDVFGIANDKQRVRPTEDFWRVLAQADVDQLLRNENVWQQQIRRDRDRDVVPVRPTSDPSPAEQAAQEADYAVSVKPVIPTRSRKEAVEKLNEVAREQAGATGQDLDEARKALEKQAQQRRYKIDYYDSDDGPFYKPEWVGAQLVVYINRKHPFYEVLYVPLLRSTSGRQAKEAVDLLLITLARGELTVADELIGEWYMAQRKRVWSPFLETAMLSLRRRVAIDPEEAAENELLDSLFVNGLEEEIPAL